MSGLFTFADDYDQTGILAGVDASESRYWWMPELYATADVGGQPAAVEGHSAILERTLRGTHAARRAGSRSTAAA